jgi:hypothetical protein
MLCGCGEPLIKSQVIPEGAGRVKGRACPVFLGFQAGFRARQAEAMTVGGLVLGGAASGAAGVLEAAGRDPIMGRRERRGYVVVFRPWCSLAVGSAWLRSSLRGSRGCRPRGHGAVRGRAAGSIRGTAAPPGAGARPAGDHALPVSGPAHAASAARLRPANDLTCPSRIA